ncbi:tRNA pseudouridine(38-40) synthase TruA [bacterium]|nr:tRNA pseudouridine(38-40) synthase TruA [bacterium]
MNFYLLRLSYDGSSFFGCAKQPYVRTVQDQIEKVLNKLFNEQNIEVVFAGRTDKGVHAINQACSFGIQNPSKYSCKHITFILNKLLPPDIRIKSCQKKPGFFNARFDCKQRSYIYYVQLKPFDIFQRNYVYQYDYQVNFTQLKQTAKIFLGQHDFLSYSTSELVNTTRIIKQFSVTKLKPNLIKFHIVANGFLRSQIRMMIGCLLKFNEHKLTKDDLLNLLNHPQKGKSIFKVASTGLYFANAKY